YDLRQPQRSAVKTALDPEIDEAKCEHAWIAQGRPKLMSLGRIFGGKARGDVFLLVACQPRSRGRTVRQPPEHGEREKTCRQAFKKKQPSPACEIEDPIHLKDQSGYRPT